MKDTIICPVCGSYEMEPGDVQQIDYSLVKTSGDYCFDCCYSEPMNWTSSFIADAKREYVFKVLRKMLETKPEGSGDDFLSQ